jgi:hypothetical protein
MEANLSAAAHCADKMLSKGGLAEEPLPAA